MKRFLKIINRADRYRLVKSDSKVSFCLVLIVIVLAGIFYNNNFYSGNFNSDNTAGFDDVDNARSAQVLTVTQGAFELKQDHVKNGVPIHNGVTINDAAVHTPTSTPITINNENGHVLTQNTSGRYGDRKDSKRPDNHRFYKKTSTTRLHSDTSRVITTGQQTVLSNTTINDHAAINNHETIKKPETVINNSADSFRNLGAMDVSTASRAKIGCDGTGGPPKTGCDLDDAGGLSNDNAGLDGTGGPSKLGSTPLVARGTSGLAQEYIENSITVNGINYHTTDSTTVELNGETASIRDLQPGLVLTVIGKDTDPGGNLISVANHIIYDNSVLGPVTGVNPDTREFVALGQQVVLSDNTILGEGVAEKLGAFKRDSADLSSSPGIMDVSGILTSNGAIRATRIDVIDSDQMYEVTGTVKSLSQQFFEIGAQLRVDFSDAQLVGFSDGELQDGMLVEVKIEPSQTINEFPDTTEVIAHTIIFKSNNNLDIKPDSLMSVQGSISELESIEDTTFIVSGFKARINRETEIIGGSLIDLLIANTDEASVIVTVNGTISSQEEIVVDTLTIDKVIDRRRIIGAHIKSLEHSSNEILLADINIPIVTSTQTQFIDSLGSTINAISFDKLQEGDAIEVWGRLESNGGHNAQYIADVIHRYHPLDLAVLQGNVSNIRGREFNLQGYRVIANNALYTNEKGEPLTQEAFFNSIHNRFVTVKGIPNSDSTFTATYFAWASTAKHDITYTPIIGIPDPVWGFDAHPILKKAPARPESWVSNIPNFYYIDPSVTNATDINNPFGHPQQPRASIPTTVHPGSYIELHGEYSGTYTLSYHCTESSPCWLRGIGDDKSANTRPQIPGTLTILDSQHVYIENLNFHGGENIALEIEGVDIDHIVVRNSSFKDRLHRVNSNPSALYINPEQGGQVHNIVIYDNHFENLGEWQRDDDTDDSFHAIDLSLRNASEATINDVWILENFCTHNRGSCIRLQTGNINFLDQLHSIYIGRNRSLDNSLAGIDINRVSDVIVSQNIIKGGSLANGIVLREEKQNVWVIFNEIYDSIFGIRQPKTLTGALGENIYIIGNLIYDITPNVNGSAPYRAKSYWNQGAAIALWHGNLDRYIIDNTIYQVYDGIIAMYRVNRDGDLYYGTDNNQAGELHVNGNLISQKDDTEHNNFIEVPHLSLQNFNNVYMDYNMFVDNIAESYYGCWAFDASNYKNCTNKRNPLAALDTLSELQAASQSCMNCISVVSDDGSNDFIAPSTDPANRNFDLKEGSMAIGKNIKHSVYDIFKERYDLNIYVDFNGKARHPTHPSIGAFEATID